jgi:hypothetical protein
MTNKILMTLGVVLILVGILGFFNDPILGIFEVDTLHNIIHLASGILAVIFARNASQAMMFGKVFGIVYALVAIIGFVQSDTVLNLITVNMADNVLHVVLAIVFLWIGFSKGGSSSSSSMPMQA